MLRSAAFASAALAAAASAGTAAAAAAGASVAGSDAHAGATPAAAAPRGTSAFFYAWYGTPEVDGRWLHWDHSLLPHWTAEVRARFPPESVRYVPPDDVHAAFYPLRGPYSSRDAAVLRAQFAEMRGRGGVDTAVVSWWGRPDGSSRGDSQGVVTDAVLRGILDAALGAGVAVALHLEPYEGRCVESLRLDLAYLADTYFAHPALARRPTRLGDEAVPWLFVYDAYHIPAEEWARLLRPGGDVSVRGGALDAHFMGLWLAGADGEALDAGGFDGAYSYFATDGFSHGATSAHWPQMAAFLRARGMAFSPTVGPGYDDSRIRPWNTANRRAREAGAYYARMWEAALASGADEVSVTSWNEWGEGTQIEPAVARRVDVAALAPLGRCLNESLRAQIGLAADGRYADYDDAGGPFAYLDATRAFAERLDVARAARAGAHDGADAGGGERTDL